MAFAPSTRDSPGILRLGRGETLSRLERIVILVIAGGFILIDLLTLVFSPDVFVAVPLLSIATTSVFALYLWTPLVATCALGLMLALSFLTGTEAQVLLAASIAAGLVMRVGWNSLILSYIGGFLVAASIIAYGDLSVPVNVGIYLIVATVSGAIGFALRT